ncbi:diphthine synthase [Candidatus Woesearchaeota archaeon]|nr:diphthine synthase [Candidatus Woesearchaeota archaeon]
MVLYLIGLGLNDEKDITFKGLEAVKKCAQVYLENYTSFLQCSVQELEKFYGKKITLADREMSEQGAEKIVDEAKSKDVAFLIIGDPFSATTHTEIFRLAKEKKVPVKIIHNASVLTAIGITGLQLYKFGKTTSIPFPEEHPCLETPYTVLKDNLKLGLHTLMLLDLRPAENKYLSINKALEVLEEIEARKKSKLITSDLLVVGCARLGSDDFIIKYGRVSELKKIDFGKPPYCLVIPGKLHFAEEEVLEGWK